MKKLTSFALAFALCTAYAVSALAADATSGTTNPTSGATEITTSIKPLRISFSTSALPILGDTTKKESVTSKMSQTLGARYRTRTCDLLHVKQMLYQLS